MTERLRAETVEAVVQNVARLLVENYVFLDAAEDMAAHVREKLAQGGYGAIADVHELCQTLTGDLRSVAQDFHLCVLYHPEQAADLARRERQEDDGEDEPVERWAQLASDNFGFKRVEHLAGNVGYVDLRQFAPVSVGGKTVAAAMGFVAHCDALIFDLRQNGGGDPYTVQLIESYLFKGEPKLLLTMYRRPTDAYEQIRTLPHVPGTRLPDVPVYVLTSGRTFSGGEDFAYTLKHHGRATIIGETTGGGGHLVDFKVVHEGFVLSLPTGRPIHPETGGDWEGTGVEPHIPVPREDALGVAHVHALETIIEKSQDKRQSHRLKWALEAVKATYAALVVDESLLRRYAGTYGNWLVTLRNGALYMSSADRSEDWKLVPITDTLFVVDEQYNARFVVEGEGAASAFVFLCRDDDREIRKQRTA
jgi:hypothetical protein